MKKIVLNFRTIVVTIVCIFIGGCSDDIGNKSVNDPAGTILLSVRNKNNGSTYFTPEGCSGSIYIDEADNFTGDGWQFAAIGNLKGLGNVTSIPKTGWSSRAAVVSGFGYVAVNNNSYYDYSTGKIVGYVTYVRLYVDDYLISSTSSGVIGAYVKYQSPFNGANKLKFSSDPDIYFESEGGNYKIDLENPVSYSVMSNNPHFSVMAQLTSIVINAPESIGGQSGEITISSEGMEDVVIKVTQHGEPAPEPYLYFASEETESGQIYLSGNEGIITLSVESNTSWMSASNELWCTTSSFGFENGLLEVSVTENKTGKPRSALVSIFTEDRYLVQTVEIIQRANFQQGDGSAVTPYQITNAYELDLLRDNLAEGLHFDIMNNIDLTDFLAGTESGWEPIGDNSYPFRGYLHGNGYKITGLWIDRSEDESVGLFGSLYGANIEKLGVETSEKGILGRTNVGILAGYMNFSNLMECYTKGKIEGRSSASSYVGGLAGNSVSTGSHYITDCYSTADILVGASNAYIGGIIGTRNNPGLRTSYFTGTLNATIGHGTLSMGGIVGSGGFGISNCHFNSEVSGVEGGNTTDEMKQQSTYVGWNFDTIWRIEEGLSYPVLRCFDK